MGNKKNRNNENSVYNTFDYIPNLLEMIAKDETGVSDNLQVIHSLFDTPQKFYNFAPKLEERGKK